MAGMKDEAVLSEEVFEFLSDLRKEDLELLRGAIALVRALRILGRLLKWLIVSAAAAFLGGMAIWERVMQLLGHAPGK